MADPGLLSNCDRYLIFHPLSNSKLFNVFSRFSFWLGLNVFAKSIIGVSFLGKRSGLLIAKEGLLNKSIIKDRNQ